MTKLNEAEQQMRDNLANILIGAGWSATCGAAFHDLGEAIPAIMWELECKAPTERNAQDSRPLREWALSACEFMDANGSPDSLELVTEGLQLIDGKLPVVKAQRVKAAEPAAFYKPTKAGIKLSLSDNSGDMYPLYAAKLAANALDAARLDFMESRRQEDIRDHPRSTLSLFAFETRIGASIREQLDAKAAIAQSKAAQDGAVDGGSENNFSTKGK